MSSAEPEVGTLLRALTKKLVPHDDDDSVLKCASRLLESSIGSAPSLQALDSVVSALLTRLVRDGFHAKAQRLAKLAAQLKLSAGASEESLWAMLYLLSALKGTATATVSTAKTPTRKTPTLNSRIPRTRDVPPTTTAFESGTTVPPPTRRPLFPENEELQQQIAKPYANANNVPVVNETESRVESVTHSVNFEGLLLSDLVLIVQGHDGKHLKLVGESGNEQVKFASSIECKISAPMKAISSAISELGFLFRLIRQRIDAINQGSKGLVQLNFAHAVESELDGYYKSICTLEANPATLTLRSLYKWAEDEKERLRVLGRLCDEMSSLRGGQVLAHVRMYRGSYLAPDIQVMLSRIFARAAASLNRMLESWLSMGVIDDPHSEFFIMMDPKVAAVAQTKTGNAVDTSLGGPNAASGASNRIWWGLYKVRSSMLPAGKHRKVAERALSAGKSIAFLRKCCNDHSWVEAVHSPLVHELMPKTLSSCKDKHMLGFEGLDKLVEAAERSASKRLMELFYDKFDLGHHFAAIKRYLLLSQGDFTQSLIDSLAEVLEGDGNMMLNSVTGIVDAALRSASSFNESTDMDILERLNVKIVLQENERRIGWDVFSLTYRVEDAPLNTVFSAKVMEAYTSIFRFLWRLKRMNHLVTKSFVLFSTYKLGPVISNNSLARTMRKAHFLRMKMCHLVQNVEYYCTFEVLEGNWMVLEKDMAKAQSLGELIESHAKYLVAIKDRTLLSERCKGVLMALNKTLDCIPRLANVTVRLCSEWEKHTGQQLLSPKAGSNARLDRVRARVEGLKLSQEDLDEEIEDIESEFDESFVNFLEELREHAVQDYNCLFLVFRLDYNGYFNRLIEKRQ